MNEGHSRFRALLAAAGAVLLAAGGGCRALPPPRTQPVPRLQIQEAHRAMVMRAYGTPKLSSHRQILYVGPEPESLSHGSDGWMTVLTFNDRGLLTCQEFMQRGTVQGYQRLTYWIKGDLTGRNRAVDADREVIARSILLAQEDFNYLVTTNEPDLFVLVRRLPSENEPVVQWHFQDRREYSLSELTVNALPGRDEPLMEHIEGAIRQRMLLIQVSIDHEGSPSASPGAP
ncbi:MAG: hypothetical protein BIFFINMI_02636 [Phycisphaerae bacterium]|nr:hypothetical protein [Phycisphaerae bacterium]